MNNQEELIETEYNRAVNLWNETYSECKLVDLKGKPLSVEPMFDICLDIFASKCKKVLDFVERAISFSNVTNLVTPATVLALTYLKPELTMQQKWQKLTTMIIWNLKLEIFLLWILMRMALLMALFCLTFLM